MGKLGLGLLLTLQVCQIYIASVLKFVVQLEDLPADFVAQEQKAIRAPLPGPSDWIAQSF